MANIYDIELLNSIMNPKTPRLGLEPLYPNFGAPMPMEESDIAPEYGLNLIGNDLPYLKELTPMTDMGATGITPQLAQSIMQQAQLPTQFGTSVDNFQGFTDKEDFLGKTEQYETDKFGYRKQSGIAKLFEFLGDFPTPFNLARRGLESLRGLNNRIQNSDFGQSDNFAEFLKRRRDREALARDPNIFQDARDITNNLKRTDADDVIDRGRGQDNIASRAPKGPTGARRGIDSKNKSSIDPAVGRKG